MKFNFYAFKAIYLHEMDRFRRTLMQSLFSPVLSTSLYFIVFGSVIGGYVENIDGISYGSYIVPGLLMLTLLTQSISNTSFGIFFPKFNGTIYEILAAPISTFEIVLAPEELDRFLILYRDNFLLYQIHQLLHFQMMESRSHI